MNILWVAGFGVLGVLARYGTSVGVHRLFPVAFPLGTLLINVSGSFLIAILHVLGAERTGLPEPVRLGMMIGFLGGFTTFSSFSLETLQLLEQGRTAQALVYGLGSPLAGVLAAFGGVWLMRSI